MNADEIDEKFEALLGFLRTNRGFDFTGYKRPSLKRRINKRMQMVGLSDYVEYTDYLQVHPEEFPELFNTILINVTSFFRDLPAWDYLAKEIIPKIITGKGDNDPIRVWSAGCASGEEPYTAAILLAEALGEEGFRRRVKIYATDVDEEALSQARQATYSSADLEPVPLELREKYFETVGKNYVFRNDLRRSIIFGRHDLVTDAPISRLDLLICRNTLMYFNSETQGNIIAHFHFALNDDGFLFMGRSELLLTHARLFTPTSAKHRIFAKVSKVSLRDRLLALAQVGNHETTSTINKLLRLRDAALEASPLAHVIVDLEGNLALANEKARTLFKLRPTDMARPIQDLEMSYRPTEVRSLIEKAYTERRPVVQKEVEKTGPEGTVQFFDVRVIPLTENGKNLGVSITYEDVTSYYNLRDELEHSKQNLETAYEELQSANEELETTNEELQSTVEELETTNEELQSTNEEMETMNEELQSTNEELQTINDELRKRTEELNRANDFLESILTGLNSAVIVVDNGFNVTTWNPKAEDFWGLRSEEVIGKSFLSLDIGLPINALKEPLRDCLKGKADHREIMSDAINRRGKSIEVRIIITPLTSAEEKLEGAIMLMEEQS